MSLLGLFILLVVLAALFLFGRWIAMKSFPQPTANYVVIGLGVLVIIVVIYVLLGMVGGTGIDVHSPIRLGR